MAGETDDQRRTRRQQRILFDGVAWQYDASRQSYPLEIVDTVLTSGQIGPGSTVLEIGCGTGQLTRQLAGRSLGLTVLDIGAAMVASAKRNVTDPTVRFEVSAFEEFTDPGPFDLIVSATAFHWIDPEVGLVKAARLLRPGGWLALLSTGERYPEPLRTAIRELWMKYSRTDEWADKPSWVPSLQDTTLFGQPVETTHERDLRLRSETLVGVESTRATFLSYGKTEQAAFRADLRQLLEFSADVEVVQETLLAMAQRRT
jgi:ubiquinone/menaquinone biosynthesis C-methylase UbiE